MIVYQLITKDMEFFQKMSKYLNTSLIEKIELLAKTHKSIKQIQENNRFTSTNKEIQIEKKSDELKSQDLSHSMNQNSNNNEISNAAITTSKLRAVKFSK